MSVVITKIRSEATSPTLIISFMSRKPEAKAVPADAPAQGNRIPTATLGMSMAMLAGLKPTSRA